MSNIQSLDFDINLGETVLWEYEEAINLNALRAFQQTWLDENHRDFWNDWITDVFDVRTANDFGLGVWAKILNIQLYTDPNISPSTYPNWGFSNFGHNFFDGNFAEDGNRVLLLSTDQKRIIILMRYFSLTNNQTAPAINRRLRELFGLEVDEVTPRAFVIDNLDMTITYYLSLTIDQTLRLAMESLGVLPRPSAVALDVTNVFPP